MKSIYLANYKPNIDYVYSKEVKEELKKLTDIDDFVYSESDLKNDPDKFREVEYIFSTWSMPGGGEDNIADYFPNCKAIFYAAGTVKYFANGFLKKGVKIYSAYAANAVPVAEYTVAQIILANKGYFLTQKMMNGGSYNQARDFSGSYFGNYGATVGIVGIGAIGKLVVEMLKPYKLNLIGYDEFLSKEQFDALGIKKVDLETLFKESDVITNHLANVPETVGIFTKELFASMKEKSTFINTGRGAQVNEDGLLEVLTKRQDITALLDVTVEEPPRKDSKMYSLKNIFLTPHIAGSESNEVHRMSEYMLNEFENYLNGRPTKYEVTLEKLSKMA